MSMLNRLATKKFIIREIRTTYPDWAEPRVSSNVLDIYDNLIGRIIIHSCSAISTIASLKGCYPMIENLLNKSKVLDKIRTLMISGYPFVKGITLHKELAISAVEQILIRQIKSDISNHRRGHKTFTDVNPNRF